MACPRRPKPVMSVQAWTPTSCISSEALSFKVAMHLVTFRTSSSLTTPAFTAVLMIPVPNGLVSISLSPALAPPLVTSRLGCTVPVTERPYFNSASIILCPPTSVTPASRSLSTPPLRISCKTEISRDSIGKQTKFMAVSGLPPIA
jgi:hypothetical protein